MAFGRKKAKAEALIQTGEKGVGVVQNVQDTGMTVNDNPRVKMLFRIEPLDGSAPFDAEKKTTVSRLAIPRIGERYAVWYDRDDHTTWAYGWVSDDTARQHLRETFGVVADSFVGMGAGMAPPTAAPVQAPAVPAGWQPDPRGEARLRYWDGQAWTNNTA
jgi:uncharacterized protein DUF2510